jgi:hypothetical protein
MRAAGLPPISTVDDPMAITSGGPAQVHISPTQAAGNPPIKTVGLPGGKIGPPTCGTGPVNIGQTCISVIRAAAGMFVLKYKRYFFHSAPFKSSPVGRT